MERGKFFNTVFILFENAAPRETEITPYFLTVHNVSKDADFRSLPAIAGVNRNGLNITNKYLKSGQVLTTEY